MDDKKLTNLSSILEQELKSVIGIKIKAAYLKETKQILINGNDTDEGRRLSLKLNFFHPESKSDSQTSYPLDRFIMRITDIEVVPERQGYGSNVVKSLLKIVPKVVQIERVILFAISEEIKEFWEKMNFQTQSSNRPLSMHMDIKNNMSNKLKRFINKIFNKGRP